MHDHPVSHPDDKQDQKESDNNEYDDAGMSSDIIWSRHFHVGKTISAG
jgi:hypothetical protein